MDVFETGTPHSGREVADGLRSLHVETERYLERIPPQVFVRPQGDKWSPADHVRHLSKSNFPVAQALKLPRVLLRALFGKGKASLSFEEMRVSYRAKLEAGAKAGRFAPVPKPRPGDPEAWRREVLEKYRLSADSLRTGIARWSEAELDAYRLPHPLFGKLTVREMLFFTLYHNAHHVRIVAGRVTPPR
ncbi:MAG: DinB family protein [Thermoanaerobaculia bacterium]